LDDVPVRFLDIDEQQASALALADNKLGEMAGWNVDMLAEVLASLQEDSIDLDGIGWNQSELDDLLNSFPTVEPDGTEDDVPDVSQGEPDSVPGEVYELGPHRLVCGDCTDPAVWDAVADGMPDAVFTDPPYGMCLDTNYGSMHTGGDAYTVNRFDPVIGDEAAFDAAPLLERFAGVKEQFWWGADYYRSTIESGGSWVVWDKRTNESGMDLDKVLGSVFELCWSRQKHRREIARILWSGHHGMSADDTKSRVHPTQKPAALCVWFLERWVKCGGIVADFFGGSGSTLIACAMTGRSARLIELDPRYCDVIRRRWTKWAEKNDREVGSGGLHG
jgi:DNA modification methylase